MLGRLVTGYQNFERALCLNLQGQVVYWTVYLPVNTVLTCWKASVFTKCSATSFGVSIMQGAIHFYHTVTYR
jgi:hypothetical protein